MHGTLESGRYPGGEYHYQITTSTGKSRSTQHYYFTVALLRPSFALPDLSIREEGIFDRLKAAS